MEERTSIKSKDSLANKPKNVSSHLWEKFKALEKRTNEVTQKSTEKRIKQLQKQVIDTVQQQLTSPEDKAILQKCNVDLSDHSNTRKITGEDTSDDDKSKVSDDIPPSEDSAILAPANASAIDQLKDYMNINEHLQLTDHSRPAQSTALENKLNKAIRDRDFTSAESLSDHLATRELGEKIVTAIDAKRFMEQRKAEEDSIKVNRKRKLNWGFEPKQRWETKGNM